jgi:Zn-dependent metalloprotease
VVVKISKEELGIYHVRSMSNPSAEGQPDTYKGTYWYAGTADSGGVHTPIVGY